MNLFLGILSLVLAAQGSGSATAGGGAASAPAATTVTLRAKAVVRGSEFQLSDIADLSGPKAEAAGALVLGYSPSPGRERVVSPEAIQMKLSSGAFAKDTFRILGKSCLVRVATQTIGGRELAARVAELAKPHLSPDAKLEVRGEPNEWVLPIPRGEVAPPELQITNNPASIRGDGSIDVRAMSGGECLGTTSVAVRVRLEAEVLVASAGLLKGDAADTGGFERKRVDITSVAGEAIRDAVVLKGRILARPMAKDAVLTSGDLAQAPIFRKGDQTRIVVKRGTLRIEALVRVEADAILGAQVPVTCLEFGKTLVARVCEDGTLSIDTSGKSKE